ncbi:MAG: translation initiation factor IF-2 [Flavobacterium sp.]|nr:MAG: translation initiation factor IF-2 [Flavobacterium sp.]
MKYKKQHITFIITALSIVIFNTVYSQNATIIFNEDDKIPEILALKKSLEADNKLAVGYTIQLYYGELSQANKILKEYRNKFDSWPASIEYETPNYKVWVGNFSSRLEADRARLEIKDKYPAAFILQPDRG